MDEMVIQALIKWPSVPNCFGWLGLDARGNWYLRDESVQAEGCFSSGIGHSKGSLIRHERMLEFIGRNYEPDALGQWFFQNGPQRVYVELETTPLIWRLDGDLSIHDHVGRVARMSHCLLDEHGRLYLQADLGFGLVHTLDMAHAADAVERGLWSPQDVSVADLPMRFGYVCSPQLLQNR